MPIMTDIDTLIDQPDRIRLMRRAIEVTADSIGPLVDLYRPYVDGLENLPRDGRFLLVGNHSQFGSEAFLVPYLVRRELGVRVRPLTDRQFGKMPWPVTDLLAAGGATVGAPESTRELMRHNEPILVFPGGGQEIPKFKGEENILRWKERAGFARLAVENDYPIVPVAMVGGDDVYRSITTRDSAWGRFSTRLMERISGRPEMAMPLVRGIGPTLIPRPQRMYVQFGAAIDTVQPNGISNEKWVAEVREQTKDSLEDSIAGLLKLRADDPYRELNPFAWSGAAG